MRVRDRKIRLVKVGRLQGHARLKAMRLDQTRLTEIICGFLDALLELRRKDYIEKWIACAGPDSAFHACVDVLQKKARILVDTKIDRYVERPFRYPLEGCDILDRLSVPSRRVFGIEAVSA